MASNAEDNRARRAAERDLIIPPPRDPARRAACLEDTYEFLRQYFGGVFFQEFSPTRREMVDAIEHAARYGGDQAVAGPRGDGKTRSALFVTLKLLAECAISFPLIISKSGPRAKRELKNLKEALAASEKFAEDFPEICWPIARLERSSRRAHQQTAYGEYTNMEWGDECIIFPTVSTQKLRENGWPEGVESAARGQVMACLGIEGAIRGYTVRNRRPDLAILDDIDDRESARSELQTERNELIIEEDVGGLSGPDKTIARVMLCTLMNHSCIAAKYTDPAQKPSWRGQRHRLMAKLPARMDLWEEYITLREGRDKTDPDARKAHEFYLANREAMDAGAVVTNPQRYDSRPLADGEPGQVSALQACFDVIADRGWERFNTEYQNDPPEEEGPIESGISAGKIQRQLSGYNRATIPPGCVTLTQGIDVQKSGLYWVVKAWRNDATSFVIDYGFHETQGTVYGSDEGIEFAIRRAILGRMEVVNEEPYCTEGGEILPVDLTLIDSGYQTQAVYQACTEVGLGVYPAKGHGKSHGCATPSFSEWQKRTRDRKPGDGWFMQKQKDGFWVVHCDTDRWKTFEHERWMTATGLPGAAYLFGKISDAERDQIVKRLPADSREHYSFAKHLTAEVETEDIVRGKMVRVWKAKAGRVQNHYFDASYLANVAGSIKGIRLLGENRRGKLPPTERPSAKDLAQRN